MRRRDDCPPNPKAPPSGDHVVYVERGDVEMEVEVEFDEGTLVLARVDGVEFELTPDERQSAEEDWAQREPEEHHDADAYDMDGDR